MGYDISHLLARKIVDLESLVILDQLSLAQAEEGGGIVHLLSVRRGVVGTFCISRG